MSQVEAHPEVDAAKRVSSKLKRRINAPGPTTTSLA